MSYKLEKQSLHGSYALKYINQVHGLFVKQACTQNLGHHIYFM